MRPPIKKAPSSVIIISDDAGFTHFAGEVLRMDGVKVMVARDYKEGEYVLENTKCNLILLDTAAQRIDAADSLNKLTHHPMLLDIPVALLIKEEASREDREKARAAGAIDCLVKSSGAGALSTGVSRLLTR